MNSKQKSRLVYASAFSLLLVIVGYNIWSFCEGHCTTTTLMSFSFPAKLLLIGIVVASFYLLSCKSKNKQLLRLKKCQCGVDLRENWSYCPKCGQKR